MQARGQTPETSTPHYGHMTKELERARCLLLSPFALLHHFPSDSSLLDWRERDMCSGWARVASIGAPCRLRHLGFHTPGWPSAPRMASVEDWAGLPIGRPLNVYTGRAIVLCCCRSKVYKTASLDNIAMPVLPGCQDTASIWACREHRTQRTSLKVTDSLPTPLWSIDHTMTRPSSSVDASCWPSGEKASTRTANLPRSECCAATPKGAVLQRTIFPSLYPPAIHLELGENAKAAAPWEPPSEGMRGSRYCAGSGASGG